MHAALSVQEADMLYAQSVLRCPLFEKFGDTMEQDKPTIPAHYYYFIPREGESETEDRVALFPSKPR